jgi:hypothetical protein
MKNATIRRRLRVQKLTDLLFRPDSDKNPPTHSLEDLAYPSRTRSSGSPTAHTSWEGGGLAGWQSASSTTWSTSLGPYRLEVISRTSWGAVAVPSSATDAPPDSQGMPSNIRPKKKRLFGGARRRHGRPPGSQGPPYHHTATIRDRPQGLFHALSGGCSSQCYGRHSFR